MSVTLNVIDCLEKFQTGAFGGKSAWTLSIPWQNPLENENFVLNNIYVSFFFVIVQLMQIALWKK